MVVEPENSEWYKPDGQRMNTRSDGGPTSWHGYIVTENPQDSYREFMMEFQDMQLAYGKGSPTKPSSTLFDPLLAWPAGTPTPATTPAATPKAPSAAFALGQEHSVPALQTGNLFPSYAAALDQGKLPGPIPGTVPMPGFTGVFPQFGIPLSDKATVKVDTARQPMDDHGSAGANQRGDKVYCQGDVGEDEHEPAGRCHRENGGVYA